MQPDDSRGLETLDRRDASTTTARDRTESESKPPYRVHLEVIDAAVRGVLGDVRRLDDERELDRETKREVYRHLGAMRSEALSAGRLLWEASARGERTSAGDGRADGETGPAGDDSDGSRGHAGDVPMIVRGGSGVLSELGPDPVAVERDRGDDSERDRGTARESERGDAPGRGDGDGVE